MGEAVGVRLLLVARSRQLYVPKLGVVDNVKVKVADAVLIAGSCVLLRLHACVVPDGSPVSKSRV